MALDDHRRLVEAGPYGFVAVELLSVNAADGIIPRRVALDVQTLHLELDESEAGELLDAIAGALRVLAGPRGDSAVSDAPGMV